MTSSFSSAEDELVHVPAGFYYKVTENGRALIRESMTGLLVKSDNSMFGRQPYNVVLVAGELILVPEGDSVA
jgi:hypothetical protein